MLNFGTQGIEYFCLGGINLSKAWIFSYVYLQIKDFELQLLFGNNSIS